MGSRRWLAAGRVQGGSWISGSAAPLPEQPQAQGCIADSALPGGAAPGWTRTWLEKPPEPEALPLGRCGGWGSARGQCQGTRRQPGTFRPVCEAGRRRTMGPGVGRQRRARPTSATSYAPLRPAAPTPPHFQHRLNPRHPKGAKVGIDGGGEVRPLGIFSS